MGNAKTFLEKRYSDDMELEDAIHTVSGWRHPLPAAQRVFLGPSLSRLVQALLTLKEGFDGQLTGDNIEVAVVGPDRKFRVLTPAEVADYLQEASF